MNYGELELVPDVPAAFSELVVSAYSRRAGESFSMALSGGETARACYERLAADASGRINWWDVDFYWGDERCVPPEHPDSNQLLARQALLERVGAAGSVNPMSCEEGADAYQLRIAEVDRLDFVHLGLGPDGHTASLFAGAPALEAGAGRLVALTCDPSGRNPHARMTLTLGGLARAQLVVFTVAGAAKREALRQVAAGADLPASRVRAERVVWLVDHEAWGEQ